MQTVLGSVFRPSGLYNSRNQLALNQLVDSSIITSDPRALYEALWSYYLTNGLYDQLREVLYTQGISAEAMKPLRNPCYRIVEFYVSKLWPGATIKALPIETENDAIMEPIRQVWKWSNWDQEKQLTVRYGAALGDVFLKVASQVAGDAINGRVFFQNLRPDYVTTFDVDHRDNIVYIRTDIPVNMRDAAGKESSIWQTEVWDKASQTMRRWQTQWGSERELDQLGTPMVDIHIGEVIGIDFVPFVHIKHKNMGEKRGTGAFTLSIDKIDEANRQATRLHQMLYRWNKALFALLANATDKEGRPLAPPRLAGAGVTAGISGSTPDVAGFMDDTIIRIPGAATIEQLVPNINYEHSLMVLKDQMHDIAQDQPEMSYSMVFDTQGDLSGRALRLKMSDAIDRVIEARGNYGDGLKRADAMALTIGKLIGVFPTGIGAFEAGDFEHDFDFGDVIPTNDLEDAQAQKAQAEAAVIKKTFGVPNSQIQLELGYSQDEIDQFLIDKASEDQSSIESAQRAFNAGAVPIAPAPFGNQPQEGA